MSKQYRLVMFLSAALFVFVWPASAQTEFVVIRAVVNPVMQPKKVEDALQECANSNVCRALADSAAAYMGVPPGTISAAMAAVPRASRDGEEGRYSIRLPKGYQYCRSRIVTKSVVPATGDRASVMSARSRKDGVGVYTWTPRRGLGAGRSWIEATYTIYGVRDDLAAQQRAGGTCKPIGKILISCRGARGVNKGTRACGTVAD